jgi:hypothetical protein
MRLAISRRTAVLGATAALVTPSVHAWASSAAIVPFRYTASADALVGLKKRLHSARWPEGETTNDWSQGVPPQKMHALIEYWANQYDWRKIESHLNSFPQFLSVRLKKKLSDFSQL